MRILVNLFLVLFVSQTVPAQSHLDSLAQRLRLFGERIPQEKVYVHLDNTCYFHGDTIWFKAYARQTNTNLPSNISKVLYAELWNNDGYLVERKLIEMKNGEGCGFFSLEDSLIYGGYYELRAYTRWQLNWGEFEHRHKKNCRWWFFNNTMAREYFRDYDKLYSRVFPVYDHPQKPGEYFLEMTLRPLQRQYGSDYKSKNKLELTLYPEGGQLVEGVPCNVAFEAAMTDGEYRSGNIVVYSNKQGEVARASTENRGRGSFKLTPQKGERYVAEFTAEKKEEENKKLSVKEDLPKAETDGIGLQVERNHDSWLVRIQAMGVAAQKELGVTVMNEGILEFFRVLADSSLYQLHLRKEQLRVGVNQVTVFNIDGRIYADRLFFVSDSAKTRPTLSVSGLKERYGPFEQIDIDLAGQSGSASISLAVRDAIHSAPTYDSGNIMTEMLLASEIKGYVPQPDYFFEADDEEHHQALDLLMLTQGWRRFNWQEMAIKGRFELVHPAEYTPILTGSVHKYQGHLKQDEDQIYLYKNHLIATGMEPEDADELVSHIFGLKSHVQGRHEWQGHNYSTTERMDSIADLTDEMKTKMAQDGEKLRREVRVHAEFVDYDTHESVIGDVETKRGRFTIKTPKFYGSCLLFLAASDTTKWKRRRFLFKKRKPHQWIMPDEDEYPEYYLRLAYPYPHFVKPYNFYHQNLPEIGNNAKWDNSLMQGWHMMKEVSVRNRRSRLLNFRFAKPVVVMDAYDAFNTVVDAGFIEGWYTGADNLGSSFGRFLVADMGGGQDYQTWATLNYTKSKTVHDKKLTREEGYLKYADRVEAYCDYSPRLEGDPRFSGVDRPNVTVAVIRLKRGEERVTYRDRFIVLPGFSYQEDFYHPDYRHNPPTEGQKDYRRTLYWNPNLKLDSEGKAHVTLFNNSQTTTISVEAEGQASDGKLLYTK